MPKGIENIRTLSVSPTGGKDHRDTKVVEGVATPAATMKQKNETTQYRIGTGVSGPLGHKAGD